MPCVQVRGARQQKHETRVYLYYTMDLSAYELARLANIRRNQAELARLGLEPKRQRDARRSKQASKQAEVSRAASRAAKDAINKRKRENTAKRAAAAAEARLAPRRSKRLRRQMADGGQLEHSAGEEAESEEEDDEDWQGLDYDVWPHESAELDTKEFLIYVKLRAWRLAKKNELECEPYKICQNRTLCELIRRRRNDSEWAVIGSPTLEVELVECWGVGPAKASDTPKGFARMLVRVMEEDDEITTLLEKSRREPELPLQLEL